METMSIAFLLFSYPSLYSEEMSIRLLYIVFYYVTWLVNEVAAAGTRYFRYV